MHLPYSVHGATPSAVQTDREEAGLTVLRGRRAARRRRLGEGWHVKVGSTQVGSSEE